LRECLATGDALFAKGHLTAEDEAAYGRMNHQFHEAVISACPLVMLRSFVERLNKMPFIGPSVIAFDEVGLRNAFNFLLMAHQTHHSIVNAISERDSARAEALFREHGRQQRTSMFNRRAARVRKAAA
jgi:GntR family transcriptional regulator, vanillate catabolism transcriptional regulator